MMQTTHTAKGQRPLPGAAALTWSDPSQRVPLILIGVITLLVIAAYWNMLWLTASYWDEPQYSHGWLVPAFAIALLWIRREAIRPVPALDRWIGLGVFVLGLAMRIVGSMYFSNPVDRLSFLVVLFGALMMVGGWHIIRWAGPAIGFLIFMYPLPTVLERHFAMNLQKLATIVSTYVFQAMGFTAIRRGNSIYMDALVHGELNVAEACSGLRMMTIFIAISVAIVLLVERPWWDKLVILVSSIPIAIFVNVVRITITGLLFMTPLADSERWSDLIAHDLPGYIMPIMAMGIMGLELWVLSKLMVPEDTRSTAAIGMGRRPPGRRQAPVPR